MNIAPVYRDIYNWHREALAALQEPDAWERVIYPGMLALWGKYPEARGVLLALRDCIERSDAA